MDFRFEFCIYSSAKCKMLGQWELQKTVFMATLKMERVRAKYVQLKTILNSNFLRNCKLLYLHTGFNVVNYIKVKG